MTPEDAERYHAVQIGTFANTTADQVTAITMTNAEEAIGIVRAAVAAGIPAAISFTVETDGRLPTGQTLREAIEQVDAATDDAAAYFMVNCAHPTHFADALEHDGPWLRRLAGLRANASDEEPRRTRRGDRTRRGRSRPISAPGTPRCGTGCRRSPCSADAAAPMRATSRRSSLRGGATRLLRDERTGCG